MSIKIVEFDNGRDAKREGFASFNSEAPHVCIEAPNVTFTISVKSPDGELTTFSFIQRPNFTPGHQCVDILHHTSVFKNVKGLPLQQAALWTSGRAIAAVTPLDNPPCTQVVLSLPWSSRG